MPSQTNLLDRQMFGLEVLHPGLATPTVLTMFIVIAATDSLIINCPLVFPSTLTCPIEEEERSWGQGRPHT